MQLGGQCYTLPTSHPGKRPVSHWTEGWVGPSTSLYGCRRSCSARIWSSDHPGCSESLYWLHYPASRFARRCGRLSVVKNSFGERNNHVTKLHVVLDFQNFKWFHGMPVNGILFTPIGKDQPSICWFPQNSEDRSSVCYAEFYQNGTVNVGSTSLFMICSKVHLSLIWFSQCIHLVSNVTGLNFIHVGWKYWKYWKIVIYAHFI
jgi:hypothetical protein